MDTQFQFRKKKKFSRPISQQCEYTDHHWTAHLKMIKMVTLFHLCSLLVHIHTQKPKFLPFFYKDQCYQGAFWLLPWISIISSVTSLYSSHTLSTFLSENLYTGCSTLPNSSVLIGPYFKPWSNVTSSAILSWSII
jgi:hypothetical protein